VRLRVWECKWEVEGKTSVGGLSTAAHKKPNGLKDFVRGVVVSMDITKFTISLRFGLALMLALEAH
jgi:hypothetical protein